MFRAAVEFPSDDDELWASAFHCFTCGDLHTRLILYCENGHFNCGKCSNSPGSASSSKVSTPSSSFIPSFPTKISRSSTSSTSGSSSGKCSCSKKITSIRVPWLENIVRGCKYHCEHECGISLTNEEYSFHVEEACRFRPVDCPLCHTMVEYKHYLRHLKRVHNVSTFTLDENGAGNLLISNDTESMYFTSYADKTFFLRWAKENSKFWVQSFQNTNGISVTIEAATFKCNIRISKAHAGLNCPDNDVVRLVLNEKIKLKFLGSVTEFNKNPTPVSSGYSSPRDSSIFTQQQQQLPTIPSDQIYINNNNETKMKSRRPMNVRDSAMSITSSSSSSSSTDRSSIEGVLLDGLHQLGLTSNIDETDADGEDPTTPIALELPKSAPPSKSDLVQDPPFIINE